MQHLRVAGYVAVLVVLTGCSALSPDRFLQKVAYSFESKAGESAMFDCKESSGGKCYLMVGAETAAQGRRLDVDVGQKVELQVAETGDMVCVSAIPDIRWPACQKKSAFWIARKGATSVAQYRFSAAN